MATVDPTRLEDLIARERARFIVGLVIGLTSVILTALLWSSRQL